MSTRAVAYNRAVKILAAAFVVVASLLPVRAVGQAPPQPTMEERLDSREVWLRQLLLQRIQSEEQCATEIARLRLEVIRLRQENQRLAPKPESK